MRALGIAIWLVTPEKKVLLQQKISEKYGRKIIYYQPFKNWVKSNEFVKDAIIQTIREGFGERFADSYRFPQLHGIKRINFGIVGKGTATRYHFIGQATYQQLDFINPEIEVRFVGKEDLSKIKKLDDFNKDSKKDIILFEEDYEILLKILK
ncbi:hypothetical protein AMJ49_00820 [Parcubacteria bacterium DG_74_2]|nr:MAG: hypothetical protein AMJ49_00820 [Parcubacteria bacterium DG_74_2]